jgi:SpoVK/Ycf46/Vps4 family AAA+-type ATPase
LANALSLPLAIVRFDAVVSSYLGETAANLRKVFDFARSRPVVLFFDEFDAIGKHRTALDEHGELKRVVNSFLQLLDGFHSETLTLAATNHQGLLDSALWRRFDEILFFPKPTPAEIEVLLCQHFRQITLHKSARLSDVIKRLAGLSHADVERVAKDAIKQTLLSDHREIQPNVLAAAVERQIERTKVTEDASSPEPMAAPATAKRRKKRTSP